MSNILPRKLGYTNKMMSEYCEMLKNVVTQTREQSIGRGKNVQKITINRYYTEPEKIDSIIQSCEYYKNQIDTPMSNFKYRDYQENIISRGSEILKKNRFLYLAMEVRTGKTLTSLGIADNIEAQEVLFITKKKAITSIENDYATLGPSFNICVINYESLHTVVDNCRWDLVICDEAHGMGAFPKPSQRAESVRDVIQKYNPMIILLSGTPTPESYSQMYHQVYGIPNNPFREFPNFYRFCDRYVKVRQKKMNGLLINDYSNGSELILEKMQPYTINYTQKQAGFLTQTIEEVLEVELKESTYKLINRLKRDLVVEGKVEVILGDTPVKLMSKIHQLCSGTIKFESGNSMIVDTSKADFIKKHFDGKKIGIFYKFKEELNALKQVFGDALCTELSVFEDTDKNIALQIVSGREGISLRMADFLVYYNIDFSATSYWQSKDRMTTKERLENNVYWIFSKDGIEKSIYKAVINKKDYTVNHFKEDYAV